MLTGIYFLLLLVLSVEDYRSHRVNRHWVLGVFILGVIKTLISKGNRWVTLALTCVCFVLLLLIYMLVKKLAERRKRPLYFGGADVQLIPGMMLVQGWEVALTGAFFGLVSAAIWYFLRKQTERELPLIPWMSAGCFLAEIIYLFS